MERSQVPHPLSEQFQRQVKAYGRGRSHSTYLKPKYSKTKLIYSLVAQSAKSTCNVGELGSIPGSGRSPGKGNSYPLQYACLENSMDRETWGMTVHGVAKNAELSD